MQAMVNDDGRFVPAPVCKGFACQHRDVGPSSDIVSSIGRGEKRENNEPSTRIAALYH